LHPGRSTNRSLNPRLELLWVIYVQGRRVLDFIRHAQLQQLPLPAEPCQPIAHAPNEGFAALARLPHNVDRLDGLDEFRLNRLGSACAGNAESRQALLPDSPTVAFSLDQDEKAGLLCFVESPLSIGTKGYALRLVELLLAAGRFALTHKKSLCAAHVIIGDTDAAFGKIV